MRAGNRQRTRNMKHYVFMNGLQRIAWSPCEHVSQCPKLLVNYASRYAGAYFALRHIKLPLPREHREKDYIADIEGSVLKFLKTLAGHNSIYRYTRLLL